MELVQVDSPSFEEGALALRLKDELEALGLQVENDQTGMNGVGNLFAVVPGAGRSLPVILICTHMDTVEPGKGIKPRIEEGVIRSDGATILGADNKSAIVAVLEVIRLLKMNRVTHGDIELLFTWGEERGHQGAKRFEVSRAQAKIGFVPDGEGPIGTIITRAPYYDSLRATFLGKAAHAGIAPERGINALLMASRAVTRINLGRIDSETTANLGSISGGVGRNIVPERVEVLGEARSLNPEKLESQVEMMRRVMEESAREMSGQFQIQVNREYDGYCIGQDQPPVRIAVAACQTIGLIPQIISSCGGSDANELNAKGIQTVVLGMGGHDFHSPQERVAISELVRLSELIATLVVESCRDI